MTISDERKQAYFDALRDDFLHRVVDCGASNYEAKEGAKLVAGVKFPDVSRLLSRAMVISKSDPDYAESRTIVAQSSGLWKKKLFPEADRLRANVGADRVNDPAPEPTPDPEPVRNTARARSPRDKPLIVVNPSGTVNVTKTVLAMLRELDPRIGEVIDFGNLRLWGAALGCNPYSLSNMFLERSNTTPLRDNGFTFDGVSTATERFSVRVVGVPDRRKMEIATMEAQIDALRNQIKRLKEDDGATKA